MRCTVSKTSKKWSAEFRRALVLGTRLW